MAVFQGVQMAKLQATPVVVPDPGFVDGTVRVFNERVNLATQTTADTIEICRLPNGSIPLYGRMITDTAFGITATVAIGITGTTGKYRAAATFNTADTWEAFGVVANVGEALTAEETVFVTIAAASLPASGIWRIQFYYVWN